MNIVDVFIVHNGVSLVAQAGLILAGFNSSNWKLIYTNLTTGALITVSYQAWKAAKTDPIIALKYE